MSRRDSYLYRDFRLWLARRRRQLLPPPDAHCIALGEPLHYARPCWWEDPKRQRFTDAPDKIEPGSPSAGG